MKKGNKCAVRDCDIRDTLPWKDKGYLCEKHFMEQLKREKEECGIK